MKALKLFLAAALILAGGVLGGGLAGAQQQTASYFPAEAGFLKLNKQADYIIRVWHDGYWWLQKYSDNGDFITEYIDPVQT